MLLRVISRFFLPPFHAFPPYTRNCFRFLSLLRRVFPMNRELAWLYLHICTRNIKSPRVYTFTFVRVRHSTLSSACPFSPFLFLFFSAFHSLFVDSPRVLSTQPSYFPPSILVISSSDLRHCSLERALPVPYTIHRDSRAYRTQENTDCHLRNASPLYLYKRYINFYIIKSIERISISRSSEKIMFAVTISITVKIFREIGQ